MYVRMQAREELQGNDGDEAIDTEREAHAGGRRDAREREAEQPGRERLRLDTAQRHADVDDVRSDAERHQPGAPDQAGPLGDEEVRDHPADPTIITASCRRARRTLHTGHCRTIGTSW